FVERDALGLLSGPSDEKVLVSRTHPGVVSAHSVRDSTRIGGAPTIEVNFRLAWACVREALRDFHWREYVPFAWILLVQLLMLVLASSLGAPWGMGTAGALMRRILGDRALHYPASFYMLPTFMALFGAALYLVLGSVAIPVSLVRIFAPMEGAGAPSAARDGRILRAFLATLCVTAVTIVVLIGWQWAMRHGP